MKIENTKAQTVRAFGNIALTVCAVLAILNMLTKHRGIPLLVTVLAIIGIGARIESAVHSLTKSRMDE